MTYNANDGTQSPATFEDGGHEAGDYTVLPNNPNSNDNPSFTRTGYSFNTWNTAANGFGTNYAPGSQISLPDITTLYAKWTINQYHVALSSIENVTLTATYGTNSTIAEGQNPEIDYNTEITLNAAGLATGKVFVWDVYKTGESTTKVTVTDNKFNVPAFDVTISGSVVDLDYSNTYTSNVTVGTDKVVISNVEYDAFKAGTSNAAGSWTVTVPANTNKLHLHLACWGTESVTLSVTPSGYSSNIPLTPNSGISGNSPFTWGTENNDKEPYSSDHYKVITFNALEEDVDLTFTASSGKRFVVWGVNAEASTDPYITAANVNIANDATEGSIAYTVHNIPNPAGTLTAAVTTGGDWLTLGVVGANVPFTCSANPNTVERTATVTLTYTYGDNETTTEIVTVTQAALVVTYTYTLATSIENGKHYIITNGSNTKIMGSQGTNNRAAVDAPSNSYNSTNNEYSISSNAGIYEFVINGPDADGYYTIHDANPNTGYLYAAGSPSGNSSNNYLRTQGFNDNNGRWSISFDNDDTSDNYHKAIIIAQGDKTNKYLRFNGNNSPNVFSCYGESSSVQDPPYLYVRNDAYYEFYKDIAKYTTPEEGDPVNGWNFIASPIDGSIAPTTAMLSNTYDLFRLNPSDTKWENIKATTSTNHSDFTGLANGRGYLYANSANTTLHFSGAINTFTTENNANVKGLDEGWNLIGNPYNIPIYINKPYYTLNDTRTAILATGVKNVAIAPCTGVIVEGGQIIFTQTSQNISSNNNGNLQMTLAQTVATRSGNTVETIDNAIVSFNEGTELEKFYFGNNAANIFIQQNNEEYAIVSTEMKGEMPVNFVAAEAGEYTITVNAEDVEMSYLHLIDNIAGQDIDLIATPSYTFNAQPTDYASRFRLVFSANNVNENQNENENFAFVGSDGQLIVNGTGTIQIIDMMGRVISTRSTDERISTNGLNTGVYVLQLTTGSETKTQKIVIK
ncbi:MAG: T9SS type A sorting domain-containing protein [Bacteroidales bacterium]|nr:T9SS type A sorting domain-containing protein [Bacteroidales bacterium]